MACIRHRPQVRGEKVAADKARRKTVCVQMQKRSDDSHGCPSENAFVMHCVWVSYFQL
jgi:hypothetical protein